MNGDSCCRICLGKKNLHHIFQDSLSIAISFKIMACASVQVYEGDGLPDSLCSECLTKLNIAYDFKRKCESMDVSLRQYPSSTCEYIAVKCEITELESSFHCDDDALDNDSCNNTKTEHAKRKNQNGKQHLNKKLKAKQNALQGDNMALKNKVDISGTDLDICADKSLQKQKAKVTLCDTCGRIFQRSTQLARHMRSHSGEKPHMCSECGRSFSEASHLRRHIVTHTGLKRFMCTLCPKMFADPSNVKKHIRTIHVQEKNVECTQCSKTFRLMSELNVHMRIHTGERPFKCTYCSLKFSHSNSYKRHVRIHTGERPYCCNVCGASFNDGGNFRAHMRLHTGETPYKCTVCHKGYAQSSNLKSHMKAHKLP